MELKYPALNTIANFYRFLAWFTGTINTVRFDFGEGADLTPQEKLKLKLGMD